MRIKSSTTVAIISLGLVFSVGVWVGVAQRAIYADTFNNTASQTDISKSVDLEQFWRAWHILENDFVQTHASGTLPSVEERVRGAITGLTSSYADPYTVYFPPKEAQLFNDEVKGSFGGVGMEIDNNADGQVVVVAPLKDSPAERAGFISGDIIVAVDSTSTVRMNSNDAIKIIRGVKGTPVRITIIRKGQNVPQEITVVRDTINIPILKSYKRGDGIFVIELYSFSANSTGLFRDALRQFLQSGSHKLILDLRGNPGGYLDAAVNMASYFLPSGDIVVTEDYKGKRANVDHRSFGYNVFSNDRYFSMVIITDQGSASASEILAGALQQHNVAKLIGTRTFGKGSVQELVELGDGAELKVTVARWLTPNGSSISDGGLTPDIDIKRTPEDRTKGVDPQTEAAVRYLLSR